MESSSDSSSDSSVFDSSELSTTIGSSGSCPRFNSGCFGMFGFLDCLEDLA
ncbi:6550_t:CDS:2 [Ambispora gerdemannii]|uniref:6550_t:CDS:1 n=1 Tax=Ambispora gerdemannii TaxID=144530 RepID=A0A9N9GRR8_9GLOM|nr:6550_t:CDS:2 [Ambispora gerdemannii]